MEQVYLDILLVINNKLTMVNQYKLLVDSLKLLGLSYAEQKDFLPDYVDIFDEVISDFDNSFRLLPALMERQLVSYKVVKEILECYNLIELNLSIEERLTDESFEVHESWKQVRDMARKILTEMGEPIETP